MDPKAELIMKSFDIKKLNRSCNSPGCENPVMKEVGILEFDTRINRKRELVSLYLCNEHYSSLEAFLEKLSSLCEKGKVIEKEVTEMGYLTY